MSLKQQIDSNKLPEHLAIIMDGNGRWAKKKGFLRSIGHRNGVDALRKIATASAQLGIRYLTVYAFSSENWNRPKAEVNALMSLLVSSLKKELKTLTENEISLNSIGSLENLPAKCQRELNEVIQKTANNKRMTLTLALSYGSKEEITEAMKQIAAEIADGLIQIENINESLIASRLYTAGMPDPDLLIRTGGEKRVSNYLLWQIAYSEFYFTPKLWPDFDEEDLYESILSYQERERRFGKISEQINS